jgi:hypothetical protein
MCAPTVNINIAKPTSLRNCTVGVRQVDRIQTGTPDDNAGENLADHHRNEGAAPHAQQRARQTREHDQRQRAEVHGLNLRRPRGNSQVCRPMRPGAAHGSLRVPRLRPRRRPPTLPAASLALHR